MLEFLGERSGESLNKIQHISAGESSQKFSARVPEIVVGFRLRIHSSFLPILPTVDTRLFPDIQRQA